MRACGVVTTRLRGADMPKQMYGVRCVTCGGNVKEFDVVSEAVYDYVTQVAGEGGLDGAHVIQLLTRPFPVWTVWRASNDAGDDL